jgi:perosamine synthetase
MKIVSFPENFSQKLLSKYEELLNQGLVAEGPYYHEEIGSFIKNKRSVPVSSGGSAIFSLLAYHKHVLGKTHVIIQSNTMRALYTIPKLLGMEVIVCDSSLNPGFMSMDKTKLDELILKLEQLNLLEKTVTVYSVIGGFLAPLYFEIEKIHIENNIPLIVDMAHGHYLDSIIETSYADLAFSFYATKILPSGEGGLISSVKDETINWIRRFLAYDRFHYELQVGLNLRPSELTSFFIYLLLNDESLKLYFRDFRVAIADLYRQTCLDNHIAFLDQNTAEDFNGYKFIVFDDYEKVKSMNTILSKYSPTSPVFAVHVKSGEPLLPHWCPPTYPSLYTELF